VAPYLESDFPAYVQLPEGGTPVTLYAFAQAKTSREQAAGADFLHWLLTARKHKSSFSRPVIILCLPVRDQLPVMLYG
jgi:ABC-type Fe3+ transport system substrate-binding protein